jgi:hypothetical protein
LAGYWQLNNLQSKVFKPCALAVNVMAARARIAKIFFIVVSFLIINSYILIG